MIKIEDVNFEDLIKNLNIIKVTDGTKIYSRLRFYEYFHKNGINIEDIEDECEKVLKEFGYVIENGWFAPAGLTRGGKMVSVSEQNCEGISDGDQIIENDDC